MIVPPTFPSEADTAVRRMIARGQMPAAELPFIFGALDVLPLDMAQGATELEGSGNAQGKSPQSWRWCRFTIRLTPP